MPADRAVLVDGRDREYPISAPVPKFAGVVERVATGSSESEPADDAEREPLFVATSSDLRYPQCPSVRGRRPLFVS